MLIEPKRKIQGRWAIQVTEGSPSGLQGGCLTWTRKGLAVCGWYDGDFVLSYGMNLTWEEIEAIKKDLQSKAPD